MARPKGSTNKPKADPTKLTQKEGFLYVFPNGSTQWESKEITIDTMQKLRTNADASSLLSKLLNLIFPPKHPTILAKNEKGIKDEELAARLLKMAKRKEVSLYKQMQKSFSAYCYDAYIPNIVIERVEDGFVEVTAIRDLPAVSFKTTAWNLDYSLKIIKAQLIPGVYYDQDDETVHYFQLDHLGVPIELKDVTHFRPPGLDDYDIIGLPIFYDLVPIFQRSYFSWLALMQTINRAGAPSIFIKITNPVKGDIELANKIMANYSKNNQFTIPGNFEIIEIGQHPNDIALQSIAVINTRLSAQFSPSDFIATDGNLIGGSDEAKAELLDSFICGMQGHIVEPFEQLLQKILDFNGYTDYSVTIEFPERKFKNGTLDQIRAKDAAEKKAIDKNEYRQLIGLPAKTPEELKAIEEEWKIELPPMNPLTQGNPLKPNDPKAQQQDKTKGAIHPTDTQVKTKQQELKKNQTIPIQEEIADVLADELNVSWDTFITELHTIFLDGT